MGPQSSMDLLPAIVFVVACLGAGVVIAFGIRRAIRGKKESDSR